MILTSNLTKISYRIKPKEGESGDERRDVLVDTNLRKLRDFKEIRHDLELPTQLSKMRTLLKMAKLECSKLRWKECRHLD